jgi:6-phosphogluconate dehydrogenase
MGAKMAPRWTTAGLRVIGFDIDEQARRDLAGPIEVADSLAGLVGALLRPRIIWLMLPPGDATARGIVEVVRLLEPGDLVVDGGNSDFRVSIRHAEELASRGIRFMDVGVSGGIWGYIDGYGVTAGGSREDFESIEPVLEALAAPGAYAHVGPMGAGHYAKMAHNAVEYAVMEAYAEGYELLRASELPVDVLSAIATWQAGCSIRSWLLGHFVDALRANPKLEGIPGSASDSGMGRWATEEALRLGVPIPAITAALFARFESRRPESPAIQAVAAMRRQVGGHAVESARLSSEIASLPREAMK